MKNLIRSIGIGVLLFFMFFEASAQGIHNWRHYEREWIVGGGVGAASYFGQLNARRELNFFPTSLHVYGYRNIIDRIYLHGDLGYYYLSGSDLNAPRDSDQFARGKSFYSHNAEISTRVEIHLFRPKYKYYQRKDFTPYIFAGIGLTSLNPINPETGNSYRSERPEDERYGSFTHMIPFGFGGRLKLGPFHNLAVEGAWRRTGSEFLDDTISSTGVRDWYWIMSINYEYYLPHNFLQKRKQPKLTKNRFSR